VGIELLREIGNRGVRILIGPVRTASERRLSLLGGLVGALIADAFGVAYLAQGARPSGALDVAPVNRGDYRSHRPLDYVADDVWADGHGFQSPHSQVDLVRNVIGILVVALPLAAVWVVVAGLVLAPFVAPFVGTFAWIMRRLARAARTA
jgi:hypothetical protein